ncbi:MAG: hypothetical protein ACI8TS_002303, partial [Flavobacteriales bacterium]
KPESTFTNQSPTHVNLFCNKAAHGFEGVHVFLIFAPLGWTGGGGRVPLEKPSR